MKNEKKIKLCSLELKDINAQKGLVEFYFGAWTVDLDGDQILPTAYNKTFKENKSRIYHNRDHSDPVGSPIAFGTDENGAWVSSQLAIKTIQGADMFEQYQAGIVKGHSQEFETILSNTMDVNGDEIRVIKEVKLWGVTSVTRIPANLDTPTISMKSYEEVAEQLSKINKLLTSGNISDALGEKLMKEYKSLSEIIEKKQKEKSEIEKPKGIDFSYLVKNF